MNENKMPKLMTAKEYAKHVQADVRTVRRWMRNGLLEFTPPPKEHPHYARLIDSSQPRPTKRKKKGAKSTNTVKLKVKSTASVPKQVDKQPANIPRQVDKQPAKITSQPHEKKIYTRNPAFEKQLQSSNIKRPVNIPRQANKRPPNVASQPNEKIADQDNGQSAIVLLAIVALVKPAIDLFEWLYKKMQQKSESSLPTQTIRQNTWQKQSLQKYTSLGELFERQDKK